MRTSVQALIALVIVLMVVVGVYSVTSGTFNTAGENIEEGGESSSNRLDCVFGNPSSSDSACNWTGSNLEHSKAYDNYVKES